MVLLDPRLGCRDIKSLIHVNQTGPSQAAERRASSCIPLDSNSNQNASDRQSILGTPVQHVVHHSGHGLPFRGTYSASLAASRMSAQQIGFRPTVSYRGVTMIFLTGRYPMAWDEWLGTWRSRRGVTHIIHQTSQQEWQESSIVQCR